MSPPRFLSFVLGCLLFMAVAGCQTYPKSGPTAVVGTWTNMLGTVWTMNADGTYEADLSRDGKRDAWGKYTVEGNTLTVWRTGGLNPKHCDGKGIYHFTRAENTLRFTVVSDACQLRKQNALQTWHRK